MISRYQVTKYITRYHKTKFLMVLQNNKIVDGSPKKVILKGADDICEVNL